MDWHAFRKAYLDASTRFVHGDSKDILKLYATSEPMHICGAFGGYESGSETVRERIQWAGQQFVDGTFTEDLICEWVGADSAVTFTIETIDARVGDRPDPVRQVLRVTQAYRRGPDGWKIAHRHADFLRATSNDVPSASSPSVANPIA